jgi:hypothetical protein
MGMASTPSLLQWLEIKEIRDCHLGQQRIYHYTGATLLTTRLV